MALQGAIGGLLAVTLTMPIETIQKNFTANKTECTARKNFSFLETANKIYRESGFFGFWRGYIPLALVNVTDKFLYFYFFNILAKFAKSKSTGKVPFAANLLIGYLADLLRLPITYPIETVSFRMITGKDMSIRIAIRDINSSQNGFLGFYDGIYSYFGLGLRPAIQDVIFLQIKYALLRTSGKLATDNLTFARGFWLGAISRMIATILTYPYFRAKIEFMKQQNKDRKKDPGIFDSIKRIYKEGGYANLWKGIYGELLRGVLFNAIMMATKESID